MILENILKERKVPDLMTNLAGEKVTTKEQFTARRKELLEIIQKNEYGYIPAAPDKMEVEITNQPPNFVAGKATRRDLLFTLTVDGVTRSFPVVSVIPNGAEKVPAFVFMNFSLDSPDKYLPSEEIVDNGFAVFSFHAHKATTDNADFTTGIAPLFTRGEREATAPGKIAMWAWCAMRVMDYIETLDVIDSDNVAVVGHSRLGKTALLTGAYDERFKYVISNDSGCSGAAITRAKVGETVPAITNVFPFWFCPDYVAHANDFESLEYDQHFLLALTAPRYLMVGSAKEDIWADPASEFLGAYAASPAWEIYSKRGLVCEDSIPAPKTVLPEGDVLYQVRFGTHYMSREDWGIYMDFIKSKMN